MGFGYLVNMCPSFSANDATYLHLAQAELEGQDLLGDSPRREFANCPNGRGGNFGAWTPLSSVVPRAAPALLGHICHVIRVCSNEQVLRVDASSVVALVADLKLSGYLDVVVKLIGKSMRLRPLALDADAPIASPLLAEPFPAIVRSGSEYASPEVRDVIGGLSPMPVSEAHRLTPDEPSLSVSLRSERGFEPTHTSAICHSWSISQPWATVWARWNGNTYSRSQNSGPEAYRTLAWAQV